MSQPLLDLIEAVRGGRCVLFVGAGISIAAPTRAPGWNQFATELVRALVRRAKTDEFRVPFDPAGLDELIRDLGKPEITLDAIREQCSLPAKNFLGIIAPFQHLVPNLNHSCIAELVHLGFLRFIVTTNFDTCLEQALEHRSVPYRVHADSEGFAECIDALESDEGRVRVLKLHGTAADTDSIVMTLKQAALPLAAEKARALEILARRYCFCFIGYSGRDQDIFPVLYSFADKSPGFFWCLHDLSASNAHSEALLARIGAKGRSVQHAAVLPAIVEEISASSSRMLEPERRASLPPLDAVLSAWCAQLSPESAAELVAIVLRVTGRSSASVDLGEALLRSTEERLDRRGTDDGRIRLCELHAGVAQAALEAYGETKAPAWLESAERHLGAAMQIIASLEPTAFSPAPQLVSGLDLLWGEVLMCAGYPQDAADHFLAAHHALFRADVVNGLTPSLVAYACACRRCGRIADTLTSLIDALHLSSIEGDSVTRARALLELAENLIAIEVAPGGRVTLSREDARAIGRMAAKEALDLFDSFSVQSGRAAYADCWARASKLPDRRPYATVDAWLSSITPGTLFDIMESAAQIRLSFVHLGGSFEDGRRELELSLRFAPRRKIDGTTAALCARRILWLTRPAVS